MRQVKGKGHLRGCPRQAERPQPALHRRESSGRGGWGGGIASLDRHLFLKYNRQSPSQPSHRNVKYLSSVLIADILAWSTWFWVGPLEPVLDTNIVKPRRFQVGIWLNLISRGNGTFAAHVPRARKTIVQIGEFKLFYVIFSAIDMVPKSIDWFWNHI